MDKFLQSKTFVTYVTGLLTLLGFNVLAHDGRTVSVIIAVMTGVSQMVHAYKSTRGVDSAPASVPPAIDLHASNGEPTMPAPEAQLYTQGPVA